VSAQNVTARTLRLNQVDATVATNFLVALGAESAVSRERLVTNVNAVTVAEGAPPITETQTSTVDQIEVSRVDYEDSQGILRGLQVVADERTNSVTLVGRADLVAIATEQLSRIDVRRRQVAINLKVIDVNLNSLDAFGTSFSFNASNNSFIQSGGIGVFNLGSTAAAPAPSQNLPSTAPIFPQNQGILDENGILEFLGNGPFAILSDFILQLQASITSGNAKIVTDPTLIVQEGQTATVELTQDVPTDVTSEITTTDNNTQTSVNVEFEPAGLILQVNVDRIDDNGFVSLSVAPSITSPADTFVINGPNFSNTVFLLSNRQLSSGQIRVRDGQTLLLSGIIQESERSTVSKIPILGDIPILGALFRSTVTDNSRQELIILLTPQIIDDSDQSVFGYQYTPSEQVQEVLENRGQ
jgi:type IV pilus assembly protein PilQ